MFLFAPVGTIRRVVLLDHRRAVKYDLATAQLKDNGVFWIDFASIVQYFRNVFMNWNPALFSHRLPSSASPLFKTVTFSRPRIFIHRMIFSSVSASFVSSDDEA